MKIASRISAPNLIRTGGLPGAMIRVGNVTELEDHALSSTTVIFVVADRF
jgi:hypothetical protein